MVCNSRKSEITRTGQGEEVANEIKTSSLDYSAYFGEFAKQDL